MSKNKDKKERVPRRHSLPKEYIEAVSDRMHSTAPTKEIIENTITGVYSLAYTKGYKRRMEDSKLFKDWKESKRRNDFNRFKDWLDDLIHTKSNQTNN